MENVDASNTSHIKITWPQLNIFEINTLPRQRVLKVMKDLGYLNTGDLATFVHRWSLLQVLGNQIDHTTKFQLGL